MFDKNDPLISAVKKVMETNAAEREAVKSVNEKFGIQDRKVLPRERQVEWEAAYKTVLSEDIEALEEAGKDKFANAQKMPYIAKKGKKKVPLTPMPNAPLKPAKDKFANAVKLEEEPTDTEKGTVPKTPKERLLAKMHGSKKHITHGDVLKARGIFEDETPMTKMGIKKPDYAPAGTTPDYAKTKEQTPNRADKTSMPAGTVKRSIKESTFKKIWSSYVANQLDEKIHPSKYSKKQDALAGTAGNKEVIDGPDLEHIRKHGGKHIGEAAKARSDYGLGATSGDKNGAANRAKIDTAMEPVVNTVKAVTPGASALDKATKGDYKGAAGDLALDAVGGAVLGGAVRGGKALYRYAKGGKAASGTEKVAAGVTKALPTPAKAVSPAAREGGSAVPAVVKKSNVPSTAVSAGSTAAKTGKSKLLGRLGKAAVATAVGGAMYGLSNKNSPDSAEATTKQPLGNGSSGSTPAKSGSGSSSKSSDKPSGTVTKKKMMLKPKRQRPETRDERDNTIGRTGRPTKGRGGITTGTTIRK